MSAIKVWTDLTRTSLDLAMMTAEAQAVIAMRLWGMAGLWRVTPSENARMVSEKLVAGAVAGRAAMDAALRGQGPVAVAQAAIKPVRRRTRVNMRRLAGRGPKV